MAYGSNYLIDKWYAFVRPKYSKCFANVNDFLHKITSAPNMCLNEATTVNIARNVLNCLINQWQAIRTRKCDHVAEYLSSIRRSRDLKMLFAYIILIWMDTLMSSATYWNINANYKAKTAPRSASQQSRNLLHQSA